MSDLIDKAEALAVLRKAQIASCNCEIKTPDPEWHSHTCRYRILREAEAMIDHLPDAAIPARGVGVPAYVKDYAIDVSEAYDTMMEVQRNPAGAWQVIQALAGHIAALAPTDAAQAREDVDIVEWLRAGPDDVSISFTLQGPNGMLSVQYGKPRVAAELVEEWRRSK